MYTIQDAQMRAKEREGWCLSKRYINYKIRLKWKCKNGHVWKSLLYNITRHAWCPKCAANQRGYKRRDTIQNMRHIAKKNNGKCLSKEYKGNEQKLTWQCSKGHIWNTTPHTIKDGHWCFICESGGLSIQELQTIAKSKGGKCLSKEYLGYNKKLVWMCKDRHIWKAQARGIKHGGWCPKCGIKSMSDKNRGSIDETRKIAETKGGKCLSDKYFGCNTKLKWQCKLGHIWYTNPSVIKNGSWCPICAENIGEKICRKMFETLFKQKFPKKRPKWLMGLKGQPLELDGYCEKLGLAFERQGKHHYIKIPAFNRDRTFKDIKAYDRLKRELCRKNKVKLIEVPYTVQYEKLEEYLRKICKKRKIKISDNKAVDIISLNIYSNTKLNELQELAKSKNGRCLSNGYVDEKFKLRWQCKNGHIWETKPHIIRNGSWCPICSRKNMADKKRGSIEEMNKIVKTKGGKCLSKTYKNSKSKLLLQCSLGHIWECTPTGIKRGSWCSVCKKMGVT